MMIIMKTVTTRMSLFRMIILRIIHVTLVTLTKSFRVLPIEVDECPLCRATLRRCLW
jgi:hypothetical protein